MSPKPRDPKKRMLKLPTESSPEPWRSAAEIDADRILYSHEFRRLAGVTQVVPPQEDYLFHDRLSHSIKVAQVASTLARMLLYRAKSEQSFKRPKTLDLNEWVDPTYCYVAGLAHDIGHPPFGHAGEEALQRLLAAFIEDDVDVFFNEDENGFPFDSREHQMGRDTRRLGERSFEGNAQSTRVVANLSFRRDDGQPGLNLTLRSLAAIAKYPWLKGQHPKTNTKLAKKWSFYQEESEILSELVQHQFIRIEQSPDGEVMTVHRWVEAEIMDWADDISYAVHDLDDFYRAGLIPLGQVADALDTVPRDLDWWDTTFDPVRDIEIRMCLNYISGKLKRFQARQGYENRDEFIAAFKQIRDFLGSFPAAPFTGTRSSCAEMQKFSSRIISYLSEAASLTYNESTRRVQLQLDATAVLVAEFFKTLNKYYVIDSVSLATMQFGQVVSLSALFDSMTEMAMDWLEGLADGNVSRRLPARLRAYLAERPDFSLNDGKFQEAHDQGQSQGVDMILVAVLDYITSLSDTQAANLSAQLTGFRDVPPLSARWLDT